MIILIRVFIENAEKMMSLLKIKIESVCFGEKEMFPQTEESCSIFIHFLKISTSEYAFFPVIRIPTRVSSEGIILVYYLMDSSQKSQTCSAFHLWPPKFSQLNFCPYMLIIY